MAEQKEKANGMDMADARSCLEAVKRDPWEIQHVPAELLSADLALAAVDSEGAVLQCVPASLRTPAVCAAAVLNAGSKAARYVPSSLKRLAKAGADFILQAAGGGVLPDSLPRELEHDAAFLDWACAKNGMALAAVPEEEKTPERCAAAVQDSPCALTWVPAIVKTPAMCGTAWLALGPDALDSIPVRLRTEQMHRAAVRIDGLALRFVPEQMKDEDLCRLAVQSNAMALEFVPEAWKTPELCSFAAGRHARAFQFVPEALRTEEMCRTAVDWFGGNLRFVPESLKTPDICETAVRRSGAALEFVPEALRTPELCAQAVKDSGACGCALKFVPDALKTEALCLAAVQQDPFALEFVPPELKTEAVCLEAVDRNPLAAAWAPHPEPAAAEEPPKPVGDEAFCLEAANVFAAEADCCWPMPDGCRLSLKILPMDDGRIACGVQATDDGARLWPKGQAPCVKASYRPVREGARIDPARALELFAAKIAAADSMPEGMRQFCAGAVKLACAEAMKCVQDGPEPECPR